MAIGLILLLISTLFGAALARCLHLFRGKFEQISCGIILGIFSHSWTIFLLSFAFGFEIRTIVLGTLLVAIAAASLFIFAGLRRGAVPMFSDWKVNPCQALLMAVIMPFFILPPWQIDTGDILFLGNYSDLSFHMSMVSAFVHQQDFIPDYPNVAGARMCYHFMINFHSAILVKAGMPLLPAVKVCQSLIAASLCFLLGGFMFRLSGERRGIALLACALFVFASNGFFNILAAINGVPIGGKTLDILKGGIPWGEFKDVMLFPFFNFLDPMINYLHPQRPFLFALPLAMIIYRLMEIGIAEEQRRRFLFIYSAIIIGLCPLFHLHTFLILGATLFLVSHFLIGNKLLTIECSLVTMAVALPQLIFLMYKGKSLGYSGWDVQSNQVLSEVSLLGSVILTRLAFWVRVGGYHFILGYIGFFTILREKRVDIRREDTLLLWLFLGTLPFFILINFYRLTPIWGDSNKFFLYQLIFLCIFMARFLARCFTCSGWARLGVAAIIVTATAPTVFEYGSILLPAIISVISCKNVVGTQMLYRAGDITCAKWIREHTHPHAVFLTSDDTVHFVPPLAGRRVVDGSYSWNLGLMRPGAKEDVEKIYSSVDNVLISKYGIDYIVVSPRERSKYRVDADRFKDLEIEYDENLTSGRYTIYKTNSSRM